MTKIAAVYWSCAVFWLLKHLNMPPVASAQEKVANSYAKPAQNATNMGRQSQQRVLNQDKTEFKLLAHTSHRRPGKGGQLTLQDTVVFQADQDCIICKAKKIKQLLPTYTISKRAYPLCSLNTKTDGHGTLTEQSITSLVGNKRYKALTAPTWPEEQFGESNNSKVAVSRFLKPEQQQWQQ